MFRLRLNALRQAAKAWKAVDAGKYDLCIIGAGPAGIAAALRAADYNKKVCLIEAWRVGGADFWNGTLTSKTMWQYSDILSKVESEPALRLYGESLAPYVTLDEAALRREMQYVSETQEKQVLTALEKSDVKLLFGKATFTDNHEVQVRHPKNHVYNTLQADHFIIATGGTPREHPFVKIDGKLVLSSDHIMQQPIPKSLVIIGAGRRGCEFATIFAGLRKTKVYLVDKQVHILPREDPDVVDKIEVGLENLGVTVHHNAMLYDVRPCCKMPDCSCGEVMEWGSCSPSGSEMAGVQYTIMDRTTKEFSTIRVDRALIALERLPNFSGLGLENTDVKIDNARLVVNDLGECVGVPHILAVGDGGGDRKLVPAAEAKAKRAVDHIFGSFKMNPLRADDIARVAFLTSAVASVGLNERLCRAKGISYLAAKVSHETVSRAVAAGKTNGFVKIIVSNDPKHTILGLQAVGLNASTLVDLGSLAIQSQQTAFALADRLTAYPSVSEAFQECLRMILGTSQLKPGVMPCNQLVCWVPERCSPHGLVHSNIASMAALHARLLSLEVGLQAQRLSAEVIVSVYQQEGRLLLPSLPYNIHFPYGFCGLFHSANMAKTNLMVQRPFTGLRTYEVLSSPASMLAIRTTFSCVRIVPILVGILDTQDYQRNMFRLRLNALRQAAKAWKAVDAGKYDLCIIGAGPAGIAAALRAADYNKKVCLIEAWRVGGADFWNGTLTSKTMWQYSDILSKVESEPALRLYGESLAPYVTLDEAALRREMQYVSETREKQILTALEKTAVKLLFGKATFTDNHEVQVRHPKNHVYNTLHADHFIIATGGTPREHPFVKIDGKLVLSSDHIMQQPIPKSLVIVGGGALGCEFASIFAGLRKTKVYLVDKQVHILPREDRDVALNVEQAMEQGGVTIHHNSALYDVRPCYNPADCDGEIPDGATSSPAKCDTGAKEPGVQYTIMDRTTKEFSTIRVDRALIAVGRVPNYSGLGIENTTLKTKNGALVVNDYGQCAGVPHIYAVGDCGGDLQYVSVSEARGKLAVDYIYGSHTPSLHRIDSIARVAFLTTAVASVGLNEKMCRAKGISYLAAKVSHETVSRAVAAASTSGFVKIIVSNDPKHTILGLQAVGLNASTLVDLCSLAIQSQQTAFALADRLTAYPSVSEAFQECLRMILGTSQLKPGVMPCNQLVCWVPERCSPHGLNRARLLSVARFCGTYLYRIVQKNHKNALKCHRALWKEGTRYRSTHLSLLPSSI
eukprot:gene1681-1043_t